MPTPKGAPPPAHMAWLVPTGMTHTTADGCKADAVEFRHQPTAAVLSAWAAHFRNHYCQDAQLDALRGGLSRADYLTTLKFPDAQTPPGPSVRTGDFTEILIADYVQYALGYWVPRTRYDRKTIRNESTKGCDVIGFNMVNLSKENPHDSLAIFEVKAKFSGIKAKHRLQHAINSSGTDHLRSAESLNAIKQRSLDEGATDAVAIVARFQNLEDQPYREVYGAVAFVDTRLFDVAEITAADAADHPNRANLLLIVMHGNDMMQLVHQLYKRAADEA